MFNSHWYYYSPLYKALFVVLAIVAGAYNIYLGALETPPPMQDVNRYFSSGNRKIVNYVGWDFLTAGRQCYWFLTERDGLLYKSCLAKYSDGLHEYDLKALNHTIVNR